MLITIFYSMEMSPGVIKATILLLMTLNGDMPYTKTEYFRASFSGFYSNLVRKIDPPDSRKMDMTTYLQVYISGPRVPLFLYSLNNFVKLPQY